jgi:hypothetical protein
MARIYGGSRVAVKEPRREKPLVAKKFSAG